MISSVGVWQWQQEYILQQTKWVIWPGIDWSYILTASRVFFPQKLNCCYFVCYQWRQRHSRQWFNDQCTPVSTRMTQISEEKVLNKNKEHTLCYCNRCWYRCWFCTKTIIKIIIGCSRVVNIIFKSRVHIS